MHGPTNVKSPNNTSKWQMGFNSAFKGLILKEEEMDKTGEKSKKVILFLITGSFGHKCTFTLS
jgi:hypothetical protein